MADNNPSCIYCERGSEQIPLINIKFKGALYWICPQHLPVLIHKPEQLAAKLPGMDLSDLPTTHHEH